MVTAELEYVHNVRVLGWRTAGSSVRHVGASSRALD